MHHPLDSLCLPSELLVAKDLIWTFFFEVHLDLALLARLRHGPDGVVPFRGRDLLHRVLHSTRPLGAHGRRETSGRLSGLTSLSTTLGPASSLAGPALASWDLDPRDFLRDGLGRITLEEGLAPRFQFGCAPPRDMHLDGCDLMPRWRMDLRAFQWRWCRRDRYRECRDFRDSGFERELNWLYSPFSIRDLRPGGIGQKPR